MPLYCMEGGDGVGKTAVTAELEEDGIFTVKTPPLGFNTRMHIFQLGNPKNVWIARQYTLPGLRATVDMIRDIFKYEPNGIVVSDRYWVGTCANLLAKDQLYNDGATRPEIVREANEIRDAIPVPDGYFWLRVDSEERKRRAAKKHGEIEPYDVDERLQSAALALHEQIFEEERRRGVSVHEIDTTGRSVAEVVAEVKDMVKKDARLKMPTVRSVG